MRTDAKAIDFHSRPLSDLKKNKKTKPQFNCFSLFYLSSNSTRVTNTAGICCSASSFRFQSSGSDHIFVAQGPRGFSRSGTNCSIEPKLNACVGLGFFLFLVEILYFQNTDLTNNTEQPWLNHKNN